MVNVSKKFDFLVIKLSLFTRVQLPYVLSDSFNVLVKACVFDASSVKHRHQENVGDS